MSKPVVILDPHWREMDELFSPEDQARLAQDFEVVWGQDTPMPQDRFDADLPRAAVWITAEPAVDKALLDRAPQLKAIIEVSGAFPGTIDYEACFAKGVQVLSCAPGFRRSVAEMALGMAISGVRGLVAEHEGFRKGSEAWLSDCVERDFTLFGATIGFVGYGSIARETARLLAPFGCKILAYDPYLDEADGVEFVGLNDLAARSCCVFVCAAPSRENEGLIGADFMTRMPPSSLLVVISRAHLVDFDALVTTVESGRIKAAIDVFPDEPLAANHPLRRMDGVILSPHRAAAVKGGRQMIGELILADLALLARGEQARHLGRATPKIVALMAGVGDDEAVSSLIPRNE